MSCHSTNGGLLSLRLARAYSGLDEGRLQALYHELKREGRGLPHPTKIEFERWKNRQLILIEHAPMPLLQKERSELDLLVASFSEYDAATFYAWKRMEVRSRQEAVFSKIEPPLKELEPPGSQGSIYEYGSDGRPTRVWYASYGSNLSRARFMSYIDGTVPEGLVTSHPGCRDASEPIADISMSFPGRMHFAGKSSRWGGGGASFVDPKSVGKTLGRAYNISIEQFDDVIAQENRKEVGSVNIDTNTLIGNGQLLVDEKLPYGTLVHIGDYMGDPVVTLTGSFDAATSLEQSLKPEPKVLPKAKTTEASTPEETDEVTEKSLDDLANRVPNHNYLRTIGLGLKEAFNMDPKQQADYLRGAPGAEDISRTEMVRILTTPVENRDQRLERLVKENIESRRALENEKGKLDLLVSIVQEMTPKLAEEIESRKKFVTGWEKRLDENTEKLNERIKENEERKAKKAEEAKSSALVVSLDEGAEAVDASKSLEALESVESLKALNSLKEENIKKIFVDTTQYKDQELPLF